MQRPLLTPLASYLALAARWLLAELRVESQQRFKPRHPIVAIIGLLCEGVVVLFLGWFVVIVMTGAMRLFT